MNLFILFPFHDHSIFHSLFTLFSSSLTTCPGYHGESFDQVCTYALNFMRIQWDKTQLQLAQVEYTPTQLDFLALLFTVVKLLYIGGALPRCVRVVHLLDSAARASAQELHKTLIRNEAAYFGCVKQLVLQHPPPPLPQAAGTLPLYLCGDSHCLSGLPLQPCDACHALPFSFVFSRICLLGHAVPAGLESPALHSANCYKMRMMLVSKPHSRHHFTPAVTKVDVMFSVCWCYKYLASLKQQQWYAETCA